ncbi:permease prefix domain 1-containing protein [Streptomyces sp. XD-27]|uniref:permease prefix domain 1-containing protein n=1 Tax=Streptomyces sp. XD-27 TaxID=3062779 RepID=UPI0026F437E4|nr:permease prefix domain 1-containing protein [Streptomyces sp. XD-27]WKX71863.1 permease prefix domain 1-containing protein [Streptomyces sp. XD-27]
MSADRATTAPRQAALIADHVTNDVADHVADPVAEHVDDPVDGYVADLTAALHGPARTKARMITEIRDGLADTVAAYADDGVPREQAAHLAVREFGTVEELVPSCQQELTIAQAQHTARAVALTVPFLIACWYPIWATGRGGAGQLAHGSDLLTAALVGVSAAAALLAVATLAATGALARRLPTPRRLPLAVAWTGTTASVAMALSALTLATASPLGTNWPLAVLAGVLTAASHGLVAASARACRRCARLPARPPYAQECPASR